MRLAIRGRLLGMLAAAVCLASAGSASAAPVWRIRSLANTTVAPGQQLEYFVQMSNVGDAPMNGSEETVTAQLPAGMTAVEGVLYTEADAFVLAPPPVACTAGDGSPLPGASVVRCVAAASTAPPGKAYSPFQMLALTVSVDPGAAGTLTSTFAVAGGGAAEAQTVDPTLVTPEAPAFGIDSFDTLLSEPDGEPSTQAGVHPADQTVWLDFNTHTDPRPLAGPASPVEPVKDAAVELPAGLVGNPTAVTRCAPADLAHLQGGEEGGAYLPEPLCAASSQVGTAILRMNNRLAGPPQAEHGPYPLYNLAPPPGVPASFGFNVSGTVVTLDASVRSGGDYGVTVSSKDTSEALGIAGTEVTFWGVPSDPSHDRERSCPGTPQEAGNGGPSCTSSAPRVPFFRNPTSCPPAGTGLTTTVRIDSWTHPGVYRTASSTSHLAPGYPAAPSQWGAPQGPTGCEKVPFTPSFSAQPASPRPESPSAFAFDLSLPQAWTPESVAQSDLKGAVVTLPAGVRVNPSAANGLQACSSAQIHLGDSNPANCPLASRIGTVTVTTPLLEAPLSGYVYQAAQQDNPFGSLLALYLVVEGSGVVVKLAGRVDADPATGRLTTTFEDQPQQPFSKLQIELAGGPTAPLMLPACGEYATRAVLTGWSGKTVQRESPFTISGDGAGGACPPLGFSPGFVAGTLNPRAGAFSPLALSFTRNDGELQISRLQVTLPPGLTAKLAGVAQCSPAQIAATEAGTGSCPEASRIGSVTAGSGAGADPYFLKGTTYLTGPYNGGPFGEVDVVPAVAGPFHLGNVVVRGSIRVDPSTAQGIVVSDPLPQYVRSTGIPTDLRRIDALIDRPGFTLNPTGCDERHATAALTSVQGASADASSRFQAAECEKLAFHPSFAATTQGKTSRREGASLDVKVGFPKGHEANIAKAKVSLPKALPSRLDTLKLACRDSVFETDPAACPSASRVGTATARTPILSSTLTGPAYIVSHGGAAFPDLEIVLQGEGVTLVLDGKTDISEKTNITTSTFATVPDVPVSSFELKLPQGVHSVLGAPGGNLCGKALVMPTTLTAQNGRVLRQSTRVAVTGCKPALRVLRRAVKGPRATLTLAVPLAGRLGVSGNGIAPLRRRVAAAEASVPVALTAAERRLLAAHPGRRVRVQVHLTLTAAHGRLLRSSLTLLLG